MAKEQNRVSINKLEKAVSEDYEPVIVARWRELDIEVSRALSFEQMLRFVKSVVDLCFDSEEEYLPEVKDFAVKRAIIENYTNVALPQNVQKCYEIIYSSDIVQFIEQYIDEDQFFGIMNAVDEKIKYKVRNNIDKTNKMINDATAKLENMERDIERVLAGVDGDSVGKMINAIASGALDKDALAKAIVKEKYPDAVSAG